MDTDRLVAIAERAEHCAGMADDRQVSGYLQELLNEDVPDLVAEVRRLQGVEREALRVLGAIIDQHVPMWIDVPEEALRREYTVSRTNDPASMTVRFRAEPADEQAHSQ